MIKVLALSGGLRKGYPALPRPMVKPEQLVLCIQDELDAEPTPTAGETKQRLAACLDGPWPRTTQPKAQV